MKGAKPRSPKYTPEQRAAFKRFTPENTKQLAKSYRRHYKKKH